MKFLNRIRERFHLTPPPAPAPPEAPKPQPPPLPPEPITHLGGNPVRCEAPGLYSFDEVRKVTRIMIVRGRNPNHVVFSIHEVPRGGLFGADQNFIATENPQDEHGGPLYLEIFRIGQIYPDDVLWINTER